MSNVVKSQFTSQVSATLADAAVTVVDIPRPQVTPAEVPYAEGTDHVVRPATNLRDSEGGQCVIRLPAAFVAANIFIRRVSIRRALPAAQKGLGYNGPGQTAGALFPSGASADQEFVRDVVNLTGDTLATNSEAVKDLFGVPADSATVRSFPGMTLMAGEYPRIEFYQATGAPIGPGVITTNFKMGENQGDTGRP